MRSETIIYICAVTPINPLLLRMRSQGLAGPPAQDVATAVQRSAGLQAQDNRAVRLSVRPRTKGLTTADVVMACDEQRAIVRTWLMRGTLHMVLARDAHWMARLLGPALITKQRRRRAELGLDDFTCARALAALSEILDGIALSRAEIVDRLARHGVVVNPKGQAPAHLMFFAAASGLICRGPDLPGDEPGYVLLDQWVREPAEPEHPMVELARRYFAAFGPATVADFAHWAGIPARRAEQAAASLPLRPVGGLGSALAGTPEAEDVEAPVLRLLPAFDTYLLGYRDRTATLDPACTGRIHAGGGWIHPSILCDGRVVGTWRLQNGSVTTDLFGPLGPAATGALEQEIQDVCRFSS